jgi:TonB family protein
MRKTTFVKAISCCINLFCLATFGLVLTPAFAQNAATTVASDRKIQDSADLPRAPKALMLLAAKTNGLTGDDVKPWHLKVSFTMLDEAGKTTDQGTIEEFYAGAHKSKTVFTSAALVQTYYHTEKGYLRTGSLNPESHLLFVAWSEFIMPVEFSEKMMNGLGFELERRDLGGTKLRCLAIKESTGSPVMSGPLSTSYCLDDDLPILRLVNRERDPRRFVRNNIVMFQGHYLPGDLVIAIGRTPILKAHLDRVETLKTINDAAFIPPSDAGTVPVHTVSLAAEAAERLLMQGANPLYPSDARAAHVSGTVVLLAHIGTDGHVSSLYAVSGPATLQQAALDAVWNWTYFPYLWNGELAEVITTINIPFPRSLTF